MLAAEMPRGDVWSHRRDHRGLSRLRGDAARPSACPRHRHRALPAQPPRRPRRRD